MKSLRFTGNSQTEIVKLPMPQPKEDEVLLRIRVSALCGSMSGPGAFSLARLPGWSIRTAGRTFV